MRNILKKIISNLLVMVIVISSVSTATFADETSYDEFKNTQFTKTEILKLEPYIRVEKGLFKFDADRAIADGLDKNLVHGQKQFLITLNNHKKSGDILIQDNLDIVELDIYKNSKIPYSTASEGHWDNCGGGKNTAVDLHWWGYSRYACDCETNRMSADFNSCASVAAGVAVVAAYFGGVAAIPPGLASSYWWLLASRLDANNHGKGTFVEVTWALVFDITPQ